MHWFYIEKSQIENDKITIIGSDVNHIKNVLRMEKGEKLVICDKQGKDYYCVLESITDDIVSAKILQINDTDSELPVKLYLFQGIPKKEKMEFIIQKAVELGVYEIIPVSMKRCVVKLGDVKKEKKKQERWQSISESAAKQSGRGIIPEVQHVLTFKQALEAAKNLDYNLVPYEQADNMSDTKNAMADVVNYKSVGIFIGPEGGFDHAEIQCIREAGFHEITLGKRILRTETAGMTILSVLMFELEKIAAGNP